eukprot:COSAG02_NODE_4035_length_5880_cov_26.342501_4_plen_63_part_00
MRATVQQAITAAATNLLGGMLPGPGELLGSSDYVHAGGAAAPAGRRPVPSAAGAFIRRAARL